MRNRVPHFWIVTYGAYDSAGEFYYEGRRTVLAIDARAACRKLESIIPGAVAIDVSYGGS